MKAVEKNSELSRAQSEELLKTLEARFTKHAERHPGIEWAKVKSKLEANPKKLLALYEMERTGGEPDVVRFDQKAKDYIFFDCAPQSPEGRTSFCYDREALDARKEHKPKNNVVEAAASMGVELLDEEQYRELQKLGEFDTKSSTWIKTPSEIRRLGGALFCDRRFGRVFTYHNGAQSYYSGRGFRAALRV